MQDRQQRPKVPKAVREGLRAEAAGKCANPGCPNHLVELHHIHEWHEVKEHDPAHMVALCGACHHSVSRGELQISDEDTYRWKADENRRKDVHQHHVYVEPGGDPRLVAGTVDLERTDGNGLIALDLKGGQHLSFSVIDGEIMNLNAEVIAANGEVVVRVVSGHVRNVAANVTPLRRPGAICFPGGLQSDLTPEWVRTRLARFHFPDPIIDVPWLSLEVLGVNRVRVKGVFCGPENGFVINDTAFIFVNNTDVEPVSLQSTTVPNSVIRYAGDASRAIFEIRETDGGDDTPKVTLKGQRLL